MEILASFGGIEAPKCANLGTCWNRTRDCDWKAEGTITLTRRRKKQAFNA